MVHRSIYQQLMINNYRILSIILPNVIMLIVVMQIVCAPLKLEVKKMTVVLKRDI